MENNRIESKEITQSNASNAPIPRPIYYKLWQCTNPKCKAILNVQWNSCPICTKDGVARMVHTWTKNQNHRSKKFQEILGPGICIDPAPY